MAATAEERIALIVASGTMDRVLSALNLATGGAGMGIKMSLFFTMWGTPVLVEKRRCTKGTYLQRLFARMVPKGTKCLPLSRMNRFGLGSLMMRKLMRQYHAASVEELIQVCDELGVEFYVCDMTMHMMGFRRDQIRPLKNLDFCGVATFMELASRSKHIMYI